MAYLFRLGGPALFLFSFLFAGAGCSAPQAPPEAALADLQERSLVEAEAPLSLTPEFAAFVRDLSLARSHLAAERKRWLLLRDYDEVGAEFAALTARGKELLDRARALREQRVQDTALRIVRCGEKVRNLKEVTSLMNEGRLARSHLIQAELQLTEAERRLHARELGQAELVLSQAEIQARQAEGSISPIINRYTDRATLAKWNRWVAEAVAESRQEGTAALVVVKLDRRMTLYQAGRPVRSWKVGLGFNGLSDKVVSGDRATPEGRYRIARKIANSAYHKALLIDYPNAEDLHQFAQAKQRGLISRRAGIGGRVEIHGGGTQGMTYGCISLDDHQLDELYRMVEVGTPITIVGALSGDNPLAAARTGG